MSGPASNVPTASAPTSGQGASPAAIKALTNRLLELRRHGRPPFLVRNLKYVASEKELARRRLWDLNWVSSKASTPSSDRHLVLHIKPSRCIVSEGKTAKLLHPDRPLARVELDKDYEVQVAKCRIWLSVKLEDGAYLSFGLRNIDVCIWPDEHVRRGLRIVEYPVRETFDLSAAVALVGSFPAALTLIVEVFSEDPAARPANSFPAKLRGEICLLDRDVSNETIVPNGKVMVPLRFVPSDEGDIPTATSRPQLGFDPGTLLRQENVFHGDGPEPSDDIIMIDEASDIGIVSDADEITPVQPRITSTLNGNRKREMGGRVRRASGESTAGDGKTAPDANIVLELEGTMQNAVKQLKSEEPPHILITCWYTSSELPSWDGIVRHDYVCPWCHRNCHRLRTLLAHFQVDHDDMYFALERFRNVPGNHSEGERIPFIFNFKVSVAGDPVAGENETHGDSGKDIRDWDDVFINPVRFPSASDESQRKSQEIQASDALERVRISNGDGNKSESTEMDDEDKEFLDILREEVWNLCKVCQRRYDEPSSENTARGDFCSEYCETIYKSKLAEDKSDRQSGSAQQASLLSFSSRPRPKTVDFKESLADLPLYHVVSVSEVKEEHFDEDDPDSEEEVDHSWRLDLSLERVRHLEEATPKEKLLYMMWNKYAHENYPIPSFYAERYTRFTLELFALEYGPQIRQLQLRLQFVGFLRALHIHGLIDSVAILSIMLCLDGKKKRRDCKISSRPDVSTATLPRASGVSRGGGSGRGRRGRRRN